jgi:hypothetical protein
MKKIYQISILIPLMIAILSACSGDLNPPQPEGSEYRVEAILLKKLYPQGVSVFVKLEKDLEKYTGADIFLEGDQLAINDSGYFGYYLSEEFPSDSDYILTIEDDSVIMPLVIHLPGSFVIQSPDVRYFTGQPIPVSWTAAPTADGYIVATQPPDTVVAGTTGVVIEGFSTYWATTQMSIPSEAFLVGDYRIPGLHFIHVAAFHGAPFDYYGLPFKIPEVGNPEDNLSLPRASGRLCGMVLAPPDSVYVAEEP